MTELSVSRRTLLVLGGTAAAGLSTNGCAILSGGAAHPEYSLSAGTAEHLAKVPLAEMQKLKAGESLLVKIKDPELEILIAVQDDGTYRAVNAECTHWGCTVDYDAPKKEWTCPCHDSRFALDGKVLEGPAEEPLPLAEVRLEGDYLLVDYSKSV